MYLFWIGKLLDILNIGKNMAETRIFQKFLSGMVALIAAIVVAATLAGALLLLGFYGIYLLLLTQGVSPLAAALIMAGVMLLVILALMRKAQCGLKKLAVLPQMLRGTESDTQHFLKSVFASFMAGFNGTSAPKKPKRR